MFPDSKVAEKFSMSTSKVSYKSDCYIVSLNESLNSITQTCQMDLLVGYWDVDDKVKMKYRTSTFLVHSTASNLFTHFNENLWGFYSWKMFQISMHGMSTNSMFLDDLNKDRKYSEMPELTNIGSCSLHVIHGAFETAIQSFTWNIKESLKGCSQSLHESPARRQNYETLQVQQNIPFSSI